MSAREASALGAWGAAWVGLVSSVGSVILVGAVWLVVWLVVGLVGEGSLSHEGSRVAGECSGAGGWKRICGRAFDTGLVAGTLRRFCRRRAC